MNYHELANAMRGHADAAAGRVPKPRMATVSSYNPSTHSVKVTFQGVGDSDVIETGWLPLGAVGVGNGFGVMTAPNIGDMVMIAFTDGSNAAPKVVGRFFSNVNVPPAVPAGETWIVHKSGSFMKFHADGSIEVNAAAGATYTAQSHTFTGPVTMNNTVLVKQTLTGQGGMAVSGDNGSGNTSTITGNLNTTGTITNNGKNIGSTHAHSGVQSGSSNTGAPV
jgi:phage baseplate assembly protein V